jgi:hypothetical protein
MPVVRSSKQRRKTGSGIKLRKTKPVDRTPFGNQGCCVCGCVWRRADGVIFDRYGQESSSVKIEPDWFETCITTCTFLRATVPDCSVSERFKALECYLGALK